MRYSADDYIAARADENRGKWWTAALLFLALSAGLFLLRDAIYRDDPTGLFEWYLLVGGVALAGLYCLVHGYLKSKYTLGNGDDFTGDSGGFGGDCGCD